MMNRFCLNLNGWACCPSCFNLPYAAQDSSCISGQNVAKIIVKRGSCSIVAPIAIGFCATCCKGDPQVAADLLGESMRILR